jgi:hypothetical protein
MAIYGRDALPAPIYSNTVTYELPAEVYCACGNELVTLDECSRELCDECAAVRCWVCNDVLMDPADRGNGLHAICADVNAFTVTGAERAA